jgi:hypothetical protein
VEVEHEMNRDEITPAGIAWQDFQRARVELARKLARDSEIFLLETMWATPAAQSGHCSPADERSYEGGQ